jgi:hypothetical protein
MREITMYCSGRDQDVRVVLTDSPMGDTQATIFDMEVVCLEIGESCTGALCPVCALPPTAIDAKLAKLGLRPEVHKKLLAHCDGCDRDTVLVMSSGGYVSCTECHTTRQWTAA